MFLYKISVNYRLDSKLKVIRYYVQQLKSNSELFNNESFQFLNARSDESDITKKVNDILCIFWNDSIESIFLEYFKKYMKVDEFTIECELNGEVEILKINLQKMTVNGEMSVYGTLTE